MNTKTINRTGKRIPTKADDESRAAAAEIAAAAREVAQAGKAQASDLDAALDDPDTIPMLTDILGEEDTAPTPQEPEAIEKSSEPDVGHGDWSEGNWNRMALEVQKNVMKGMTRRTDELVDGVLRDQLDEILDRGAERLLADIKNTMQQAVRDAVADAIAEEMSKARQNANTMSGQQEKNV